MKLGDFILNIVKELDVGHIFGVPGDYNLRFLDYIVEEPEIAWIGNCNELNAAYAADGYARENGMAVLVTTHGVGELSAANGIAGAYAHNVPILHIVGYPNSNLLENDVPVHHTLGNYKKNNFLDSFAPISGATTILTAHNYITELQRVVSHMLTSKKPCYIGLPTDLIDREVDEDIASIAFTDTTETATGLQNWEKPSSHSSKRQHARSLYWASTQHALDGEHMSPNYYRRHSPNLSPRSWENPSSMRPMLPNPTI